MVVGRWSLVYFQNPVQIYVVLEGFCWSKRPNVLMEVHFLPKSCGFVLLKGQNHAPKRRRDASPAWCRTYARRPAGCARNVYGLLVSLLFLCLLFFVFVVCFHFWDFLGFFGCFGLKIKIFLNFR